MSRGPAGTPPPRGRIFFGWYIVAASVGLSTVAGGILLYGFPFFMAAILEDYPWTMAEAALAFAIVRLGASTLSPVSGWMVDRIGARVPMLVGTGLMAISCLILSQLDSLLVFFLAFALAGVGYSVYWTAPMATIGNWFRAKRALAMGIAYCGYGLSGVMAPILNWGIEGYGWRSVFVATGLGTLAICLPLSLVLRHRPEPFGYSVDGAPTPARGEEEPELDAGPSFTAGDAIRTRAFWLLAALVTLGFLAGVSLIPHLVTYLADVGIDGESAALAIMGLTIANSIGRIVGGALADRFDKRRVLVGGFIGVALGIVLFATISQTWQLVLFVVVAGPALGCLFPITSALTGDCFGTRSFAMILGLFYAAATLIVFGAPSAVGWVFDHFGTYQPAWLVLAALMLTAVPLTLMLRPPGGTPRSARSE